MTALGLAGAMWEDTRCQYCNPALRALCRDRIWILGHAEMESTGKRPEDVPNYCSMLPVCCFLCTAHDGPGVGPGGGSTGQHVAFGLAMTLPLIKWKDFSTFTSPDLCRTGEILAPISQAFVHIRTMIVLCQHTVGQPWINIKLIFLSFMFQALMIFLVPAYLIILLHNKRVYFRVLCSECLSLVGILNDFLTFSCKVNMITTVHEPSSSWYLAQV